MKESLKERVYILKNGKTPPSYTIQSRHTNRKPLLYFDEAKRTNRALRYAKNQKSPFLDEQDEHAILEAITFTNGVLVVSRTNPVLQQFLAYHPDNGVKFYEKDDERDAVDQVSEIEKQVEAQDLVLKSDISLLIPIAKVLLGSKRTEKLNSTELRRDMVLFARNNPEKLLDTIRDPEVQAKSLASDAISKNLINWRPSKRELFYNIEDNKKKLMSVPVDMLPEDALFSFLKSDDGVELYKFLEREFSK